jgi:predicted nucleic acid-binding protein
MAEPIIVLDTNVISELLRPTPAESVEQWLAEQDGGGVYLTCISEAELLHGVALLPSGRRKAALAKAIQSILVQEFRNRILSFDSPAARAYAAIAAERRAAGRPISHFDGQIAAIARAHGAVVATRNTTDFEHCGIEVINPWDDSPEA